MKKIVKALKRWRIMIALRNNDEDIMFARIDYKTYAARAEILYDMFSKI